MSHKWSKNERHTFQGVEESAKQFGRIIVHRDLRFQFINKRFLFVNIEDELEKRKGEKDGRRKGRERRGD